MQWIQWNPDFIGEMNFLVIRKEEKSGSLDNEIGEIFRTYNIMGFTPPDQPFDVDVFYRISAYACFYKAGGATVNERPADEITVSVVRETKPEELFCYFREHGVPAENPHPGIYHILGEVLFPTQIIVINELDRAKHLWLRLLSHNVEEGELRKALDDVRHPGDQSDRESAQAVFEVCLKENRELMEKLMEDDSIRGILSGMMKPEKGQTTDG